MKKQTRNKILILISLFLVYVLHIVLRAFGTLNFDQILFNVFITDNTNANLDIVFVLIFEVIMFFFFVFILIQMYKFFLSTKKELVLEINTRNKKKKIYLFPLQISDNIKNVIVILLFIFSISNVVFSLKIPEFIKNHLTYSTIYEEYYVNPLDTEIVFKEKRNLIYIILESMETSFSKYSINDKTVNLIPNLKDISNNNVSFSDNNDFGGFLQNSLNSWTIASMVGQTSGVPLNIPIDGNFYSNATTFLPSIVTIGDILEKEGYNQTIMMGSDASFGGRKTYFSTHGNYKIYDYFEAVNDRKIDDDYFVFWGYEDKKLFEYAKEEIIELSKEDKPFNFSMLTVDTHFMDGYIDDECEMLFDSAYANAVYCSDKKVYEFINWIKEQPFYDNTTIVLLGDHLTMNNQFIEDGNITENRRVYNAIVNSTVTTANTKNRVFTVLDIFPTTLASIGAEIKGNRLGLGTNLFSDEKTLPELLGHDYFNGEISKNSNYYKKFFEK